MSIPFRPSRLCIIGCSTGCIEALEIILPQLRFDLSFPIITVIHSHADTRRLSHMFSGKSPLKVVDALPGTMPAPGNIYFTIPNYHTILENDGTVTLSVFDRINHVRPAIDPLMESAARVFGRGSIGVILTGAQSDGSTGISAIAKAGGKTIVQDPSDAYVNSMPRAALEKMKPDFTPRLANIAGVINRL